jgi:hypothetical protein
MKGKASFLYHHQRSEVLPRRNFKVVKTGKRTAKKGISICCPPSKTEQLLTSVKDGSA